MIWLRQWSRILATLAIIGAASLSTVGATAYHDEPDDAAQLAEFVAESLRNDPFVSLTGNGDNVVVDSNGIIVGVPGELALDDVCAAVIIGCGDSCLPGLCD